MQQLVGQLLAAMISIIPPGQSSFSQVPLEFCDAECQATPRCENEHDFRCKPPTLDKGLYLQAQDDLLAQGVPKEQALAEAYTASFTRPETYEEGLARYFVIATAITEAAKKNSYGACLAERQCKEKVDRELQACYASCSRTARWQRSTKQLAWALLTVSSFESGWRSDVQAGVGSHGRGDCRWEKDNKPTKAWTEGGRPLLNTCNSYGLNQAWFGNPARALETAFALVEYSDVLGLDYAATVTSFNLAATHLLRAHGLCKGSAGDWAWSMFSLYGSGASCEVPSAKKRSARFWQLLTHPPEMLQKHKDALASAHVQNLIAFLMYADSPILWMPEEPRDKLGAAPLALN